MVAKTHALAVALAALIGCRTDVVVFTRATPIDASADASPDATADATADASRDAGPDVVVPLTADERLGLHTRGVAVIADGVDDARAIRFVYAGDDGQLHVERRRSETLARECERVVEAPVDSALASAPTAISGEAVVVAARDRSGAIRYHALEARREAGACGNELSPWQSLPEAPRGVSFRSAPAALESLLEGARVWTVMALASDGRVWSSTRVAVASSAWSLWAPWPALPPGEAAVSAPAVTHEGAAGVLLYALTEDPRGQRRQRRMSFYVVTRVWAPAWRDEEMPGDAADSSLVERVFEVEPSLREGPSPYGLWRALRTADGAVWMQSLFQRHGLADSWTAWRSFGAPFADLRAKASAPVIAPRRNAQSSEGEMLFLSVPLHGAAVVRYNSAWSYEPVDPPGRWREAPDPLR